jgi:hypothetical protein
VARSSPTVVVECVRDLPQLREHDDVGALLSRVSAGRRGRGAVGVDVEPVPGLLDDGDHELGHRHQYRRATG